MRPLLCLVAIVFTCATYAQDTSSAGTLRPESQQMLRELSQTPRAPAATPTPKPGFFQRLFPSAKATPTPNPPGNRQPAAAGNLPATPPPTVPAAATPITKIGGTPYPIPYTPARRSDGKHVVALDIGHTVVQYGSTSARGEGEFYFNQRIVRQLAARLERSAIVFPHVINPEGAKIGLVDRARDAAQQGAELFLSIHHDAAADKYISKWDPQQNGKLHEYCDLFRGYGVFMSMRNRQPEASLQFARLLGAAMRERGFQFTPHHSEPIPGENRPILDQTRGIYQYDDLVVLKNAPMPAALLECGVIIHREEELELKKPEVQARIVDAAASAIEAYFGARQ